MTTTFAHIEKEQINELPPLNFTGKVHLITKDSEVAKAVDDLKSQKTLGFDTESKPSFKKGEVHPVSLLQLATPSDVYLFRLNYLKLPTEVTEILADESITKVGVAIRDDIKDLRKLSAFEPAGFVELADLAKEKGIIHQGLRGITAVVTGEAMNKKAKLTNWEAKNLTEAQLLYAAIDAWASLKSYSILNNIWR